MEYHDISLKYGNQIINHFIPKGKGTVQVLESPPVKSQISSLKNDLLNVLENPVNSLPLKDLIQDHYQGSDKPVYILADDNTRPNIHTKIIYPLVLDYLIEVCDVKKEDIRILIASGTHRPPTVEELKVRILGETLYESYQGLVLIHNDQDNLAELGLSSNKTPITINRDAMEACLIIPITDSEYHYFAGVAGTVKQLFPGIAGRITTNTNHIRMFHPSLGFTPACRMGNTLENPVISEMKEMVELVQENIPIFCIDAILDRGEITYVQAGNIISLHDMAQKILFSRRVIELEKPGDLVLVSVGELGINLYQSGKGIHAAWNAAKKPGGTVLLLAPCHDGAGTIGYQETMESIKGMDLEQALDWVLKNKCSQDSFRIGNQKPIDTIRILRSLGANKIKILSEMDPKELRETFRLDPIPDKGSPLESLRSFLDGFLSENPAALVYVMKDAGLYVVPK
jgi:nickel-dependent lactate racemase